MVKESQLENRQRLVHFLNSDVDNLNGILRVYLLRAGLLANDDALQELLNSVVVEALAHAQRYDPDRPPRAWLLGIAANLVHRQQAESARLQHREPLASDLIDAHPPGLSEEELFELLASQAQTTLNSDLQDQFEQRDRLSIALGLLTVDEQRILRLFATHQLDGDALATTLHLTPGAARVRLHRALAHLRRVWRYSEEESNE